MADYELSNKDPQAANLEELGADAELYEAEEPRKVEFDPETVPEITAEQMEALENTIFAQSDPGKAAESMRSGLAGYNIDPKLVHDGLLVVDLVGVDGKRDRRAIVADANDFGTRIRDAELTPLSNEPAVSDLEVRLGSVEAEKPTPAQEALGEGAVKAVESLAVLEETSDEGVKNAEATEDVDDEVDKAHIELLLKQLDETIQQASAESDRAIHDVAQHGNELGGSILNTRSELEELHGRLRSGSIDTRQVTGRLESIMEAVTQLHQRSQNDEDAHRIAVSKAQRVTVEATHAESTVQRMGPGVSELSSLDKFQTVKGKAQALAAQCEQAARAAGSATDQIIMVKRRINNVLETQRNGYDFDEPSREIGTITEILKNIAQQKQQTGAMLVAGGKAVRDAARGGR